MTTPLLTIAQAAQRLACSPRTVYALCDANKLRHARIGVGRGAIRIPEDALEDYLCGAMSKPAPPAQHAVPHQEPIRLEHFKLRGPRG